MNRTKKTLAKSIPFKLHTGLRRHGVLFFTLTACLVVSIFVSFRYLGTLIVGSFKFHECPSLHFFRTSASNVHSFGVTWWNMRHFLLVSRKWIIFFNRKLAWEKGKMGEISRPCQSQMPGIVGFFPHRFIRRKRVFLLTHDYYMSLRRNHSTFVASVEPPLWCMLNYRKSEFLGACCSNSASTCCYNVNVWERRRGSIFRRKPLLHVKLIAN